MVLSRLCRLGGKQYVLYNLSDHQIKRAYLVQPHEHRGQKSLSVEWLEDFWGVHEPCTKQSFYASGLLLLCFLCILVFCVSDHSCWKASSCSAKRAHQIKHSCMTARTLLPQKHVGGGDKRRGKVGETWVWGFADCLLLLWFLLK